MRLEGQTVRLRPYGTRDNIQEILDLINDPDTLHFMRPTAPFPFSVKDEEQFLSQISFTNLNYNFAIETLEDNTYVGGCGVNAMDLVNGVATVGIWVAKPYWNKGYGTDAMKTLVRYLFDSVPVRKIKLNVFSFNPRAIRSYEKCGFTVEAVLKEEIFRGGTYHDDIVMSLYRRDVEQEG